jgi:hypothetical protein
MGDKLLFYYLWASGDDPKPILSIYSLKFYDDNVFREWNKKIKTICVFVSNKGDTHLLFVCLISYLFCYQ